jgi:hypothetical protein
MDPVTPAALVATVLAALIGLTGAIVAAAWGVGWGTRGRRASIEADRAILGGLGFHSDAHVALSSLIARREARHLALMSMPWKRSVALFKAMALLYVSIIVVHIAVTNAVDRVGWVTAVAAILLAVFGVWAGIWEVLKAQRAFRALEASLFAGAPAAVVAPASSRDG